MSRLRNAVNWIQGVRHTRQAMYWVNYIPYLSYCEVTQALMKQSLSSMALGRGIHFKVKGSFEAEENLSERGLWFVLTYVTGIHSSPREKSYQPYKPLLPWVHTVLFTLSGQKGMNCEPHLGMDALVWRLQNSGSQPVGHNLFRGQMILSQKSPKTIRKARYLHCDSYQ